MTSKTRRRLRERKYGTASYKLVRREVQALAAAGLAVCWRCGEPIEPGDADVGHDDRDPAIIRGPEHRRCNRGAPHRNSVSREW